MADILRQTESKGSIVSRYALLGAFTIRDDGRFVDVSRPRLRALLSYLLLHANAIVSLPQIIDALWGENPPRTARAQVHNAISALRSEFPGRFTRSLVTDPGGYGFRIATNDLDLLIFRSFLETAHTGRGDRAETIRLLRSALGLWRGTPFTGVHAPFVETARARLDEERFRANEILADLEMTEGCHADSVPRLTSLLAEYPARESLAERLALALYHSGRKIDALAVLRDTRLLLAEEYGLDVRRRAQDLESAILRGDPSLDPREGQRSPETEVSGPAHATLTLMPSEPRA